MNISEHIVGLPWRLVKPILQAASIPFKVTIGGSFNRFFDVSEQGFYVGRVTYQDGEWHILLYRPMITSNFQDCKEVEYAKEIFKT